MNFFCLSSLQSSVLGLESDAVVLRYTWSIFLFLHKCEEVCHYFISSLLAVAPSHMHFVLVPFYLTLFNLCNGPDSLASQPRQIA